MAVTYLQKPDGAQNEGVTRHYSEGHMATKHDFSLYWVACIYGCPIIVSCSPANLFSLPVVVVTLQWLPLSLFVTC